MELAKLLEELSQAIGPAGFESLEVADLVNNAFKPMVDEIYTDNLGNIIAVKKGGAGQKNGSIMLAAHMDEIGMMVTGFESGGFIRFRDIGGIDQRLLLGQEVIIYGQEKITGVIGAKPPHVQDPDERTKAVKATDLYIDTTLSETKVKELIRIGDCAVFKQPFLKLNGTTYTGKAFDDRVGVVALYQALKDLQNLKHKSDLYFVATCQEEVGIRGAITASYKIRPQIGLAVDGGFAQRRGLNESRTIKAGKGPALAIGPHVHPQIFDKLKAIADQKDIPYQFEPAPHPGGTDTYAIQMSRGGVATGLLSVPIAYMHNPCEVVDLKDIERTGRLIASFCSEIDASFMEELKCL